MILDENNNENEEITPSSKWLNSSEIFDYSTVCGLNRRLKKSTIKIRPARLSKNTHRFTCPHINNENNFLIPNNRQSYAKFVPNSFDATSTNYRWPIDPAHDDLYEKFCLKMNEEESVNWQFVITIASFGVFVLIILVAFYLKRKLITEKIFCNFFFFIFFYYFKSNF